MDPKVPIEVTIRAMAELVKYVYDTPYSKSMHAYVFIIEKGKSDRLVFPNAVPIRCAELMLFIQLLRFRLNIRLFSLTHRAKKLVFCKPAASWASLWLPIALWGGGF